MPFLFNARHAKKPTLCPCLLAALVSPDYILNRLDKFHIIEKVNNQLIVIIIIFEIGQTSVLEHFFRHPHW